MFNFFKKSIRKTNDNWKEGAILAGIDIHLPFVTMNISPADSSSESKAPTKAEFSSEISSLSKPREELNFKIEGKDSDKLIKEHQLMLVYFYNKPESFSKNIPIFNKKTWKKLEGEIQLVANEPIWFIGRFVNISGKVLYKTYIGLNNMPFIAENATGYCNGFINDSYTSFWLNSATKGTILDTMNAGDYVDLHCFCRIPEILQTGKNFRFLPYLSTDASGKKNAEIVINNLYNNIDLDVVMLDQKVRDFLKEFFKAYNINGNHKSLRKLMEIPSDYFNLNTTTNLEDRQQEIESMLEYIDEIRDAYGRFLVLGFNEHDQVENNFDITRTQSFTEQSLWGMIIEVSVFMKYEKGNAWIEFTLLLTNQGSLHVLNCSARYRYFPDVPINPDMGKYSGGPPVNQSPSNK